MPIDDTKPTNGTMGPNRRRHLHQRFVLFHDPVIAIFQVGNGQLWGTRLRWNKTNQINYLINKIETCPYMKHISLSFLRENSKRKPIVQGIHYEQCNQRSVVCLIKVIECFNLNLIFCYIQVIRKQVTP